MGAESSQKIGKTPIRWLFLPEDTTAGSGSNNRIITGTGIAQCMKCGLWVIISILVGLAIGQL
jgi:hypothetical protein